MNTDHNRLPALTVRESIAGSIRLSDGQTYGPRMQMELQLVLLHSGLLAMKIDERSVSLQPGHICLLLPGQRIFIEFFESWHRWITLFDFDLATEAMDELRHLPNVLPLSEKMNQLLDILVGLQRDDTAGSSQVRNTLAAGAFQLFVTECHSRQAASAVHPAIPLVKSFIQERFQEELELADLADEANVSPGHLIRLFREHTGITPHMYLWRYRVERGVEYLRTTGLPVGEIAEKCGFKTSYHFARLVKKQKGRTPTEIRFNRFPDDANTTAIR